MVPQLHPRTISTPFAYTHNAAVTHHFALNGQFPFIEGPSINIPDSKFHPKWFMKTKVARIYHYAAETNHCCHFWVLFFSLPSSFLLNLSIVPPSIHISALTCPLTVYFLTSFIPSATPWPLCSLSPLCVSCCACVHTVRLVCDICRDLSWQSLPKYQANAGERDRARETLA